MFKARRRKKILERAWPATAEEHVVKRVRLWKRLDDDHKQRARQTAQILIAEKDWYGRGIELTEEMQSVVAVLAAIPLLGLDHDYYRGLKSIILYPTGYRITQTSGAGGGFAIEDEVDVVGEAHHSNGPVVLSWDEVVRGARGDDGRNVVIHEFAHKLDLLDGYADGTPILATRSYDEWARVMGDHFTELVEDVERGRRTLLDDYGATNEAEFFAVVTETFFEESKDLSTHHPELYHAFKDYFGLDPRSWG